MLQNLSNNLNKLMAEARVNSSELARITGIPANTIKRIRNDQQANPTVTTLLPIAQYFSITINDLLGCDGVATAIVGGLSRIPLLSWQACARYDIIAHTEKITHTVFTERQVSKKAFALKIDHDDLDFFPNQSLLIVEPDLVPISGDYVVVTKNQMEVASIRKYIVDIDHVYLKSLVKGQEMSPLISGYKILGVIVQYKIELRSDS